MFILPAMESNENELERIVFDAQKLKEARKRRFPKLSAQAVARNYLGISRQRLLRYEQGEDCPQPTMLAQMCALYGVELLELTSKMTAT